MTQMVRKQLYLDERQNALLKALAHARQVSEAEVLRQALEHEAQVTPEATPVESGLNPEAWAQVQAVIDARRALGQHGEPYKWRREDAYEEREARFEKFAHPEKDA